MKKIGLCVCYDTKNYGSMLQALATCKQIEKLDLDYEIIKYKRKITMDLAIRSISRIPELTRRKIGKAIENTRIKRYPAVRDGINKRNNLFCDFVNNNFTKMSSTVYSFQQLRNLSREYSAVMVGSDQLWRPEGFTTGFYNLMFVPRSIPKIAFSTSFGVSSIPKNKIKLAKEFISRIENISVREIRGSEIIKELTGRDVKVTVDPTLLFNRTEWEEMIEPRHILNKGYIFCYLLGTNPEHRMIANMIKKKTGLRIITIPHLDNFVEKDVNFGDEQLFDVGPSEFVNLIRNAEYICTDSFHGTVFSIINHKQFVVFNRFANQNKNSRNSRIDSLLKQTNLFQRRVDISNINDIYDIIRSPIDYNIVDKRISEIKEKSVLYLTEALGV